MIRYCFINNNNNNNNKYRILKLINNKFHCNVNQILYNNNNNNNNNNFADDLFADDYNLDPNNYKTNINNISIDNENANDNMMMNMNINKKRHTPKIFDNDEELMRRLRSDNILKYSAKQLLYVTQNNDEIERQYLSDVLYDYSNEMKEKAMESGYISEEDEIMEFQSPWFSKPNIPMEAIIPSEMPEIIDDNTKDEEHLKDKNDKNQPVPVTERIPHINKKGYAYGKGGRKSSTAQAWITPGIGKFVINGKPHTEIFKDYEHLIELYRPFQTTGTVLQFDVVAKTQGGGYTGKSGALRLAITRALINWDPTFRKILRLDGLVTRDARRKERKKPGRKKARKGFQWVKR